MTIVSHDITTPAAVSDAVCTEHDFALAQGAAEARHISGDGPFPYLYLIDMNGDGNLEPTYMTLYENVDWIGKQSAEPGGRGEGYNDGVFFYVPRNFLTPEQLKDQQEWEQHQRENGTGGAIAGEHSGRLVGETDDYVVVGFQPVNMDLVRKGGMTKVPMVKMQKSLGPDDAVPNAIEIYYDGTWSYDNNIAAAKDELQVIKSGKLTKTAKAHARQTGADEVTVMMSGATGGEPVYFIQERHNHLKPWPAGLEPDLGHTTIRVE
jgi:hypothetical protein